MSKHASNLDTAGDLMYAMALRAKQLADMKIDELRIRLGSEAAVTPGMAITEHKSRGDLIEEILIEEFDAASVAIDQKMMEN